MKTVAELNEGDIVHLVCIVKDNRLSFDSTVKKVIGDANSKVKILTLQSVRVNNHDINFKDFPVTIEVNKDNRLYAFKIARIKYDYPNELMHAYIVEKAVNINKRRACRFPCSYSVSIHTDKVTRPFTGYCRDISYVGASYLYSDTNNVIVVGDIITVEMQKAAGDIPIEVKGRVVRVIPNYLDKKSMIGVDFKMANNIELNSLIHVLQQEEVKRRSSIIRR